MTHVYKFTGELPAIFSDLSHGNVAVLRATPQTDADGEPVRAPHLSTVELAQGDRVVSGSAIDHAYLEQIEQGKESPLTVEEIIESLDQMGVDHEGVDKKSELASLLDGALQAQILDPSEPPEDAPAPAKTKRETAAQKKARLEAEKAAAEASPSTNTKSDENEQEPHVDPTEQEPGTSEEEQS
jgi:hypothetical protein